MAVETIEQAANKLTDLEAAVTRNYAKLVDEHVKNIGVISQAASLNGQESDTLSITIAAMLQKLAMLELVVLAMANRLRITDDEIIKAAQE